MVRGRTDAERTQLSLQHLMRDLKAYYKTRQRGEPGRTLSRLGKLTSKMLGSADGPK